jgi:hypothetical protein
MARRRWLLEGHASPSTGTSLQGCHWRGAGCPSDRPLPGGVACDACTARRAAARRPWLRPHARDACHARRRLSRSSSAAGAACTSKQTGANAPLTTTHIPPCPSPPAGPLPKHSHRTRPHRASRATAALAARVAAREREQHSLHLGARPTSPFASPPLASRRSSPTPPPARALNGSNCPGTHTGCCSLRLSRLDSHYCCRQYGTLV